MLGRGSLAHITSTPDCRKAGIYHDCVLTEVRKEAGWSPRNLYQNYHPLPYLYLTFRILSMHTNNKFKWGKRYLVENKTPEKTSHPHKTTTLKGSFWNFWVDIKIYIWKKYIYIWKCVCKCLHIQIFFNFIAMWHSMMGFMGFQFVLFFFFFSFTHGKYCNTLTWNTIVTTSKDQWWSSNTLATWCKDPVH